MLSIFSSRPFYTDFVHLPDINSPVPDYISSNPKFFPFFRGAIGALDGTHFDCSGTPEQRAIARDRKGRVTQNCLAACDFTHKFVYVFSGWEGSVTDSTMFNDARITDLYVPTDSGRYYLADAGFPNSLSLMLPYRGVRYHLQEWSRAEVRYCIFLIPSILLLHICDSPANPPELFNLRHAQARNIVERIFGILKNRFAILRSNPHLDVDTQARLAPALAAIHNVIREYDDEEIQDLLDEDTADDERDGESSEATGDLAEGPARTSERQQADSRRDRIAAEMWAQYRAELRRRGIV